MKLPKLLKHAAVMLISVIAAVAVSVGAMAEDYDITVRLNYITDDTSRGIVAFDAHAPIQINSRTYVHSRGFAEAAGMIVGWDQDNKTAFIKVMADANSDKPIERYAAAQFEMLTDRALGTPSNITVSLMLDNSQALLRYNYDAGDGYVAGLGKTVEMAGAATMIEYGAMMVPLRSLMEMLGLDVYWDQDTMTVDVWIPDAVRAPDGLEQTDKWIPDNTYYTGIAPPAYIPDSAFEIGEYLGKFRVTRYCPCDICNGGWGPYTAWAGEIIPGQTIGISLSGKIPKLAWVYIEGFGWRRAEDTGGGVSIDQIDVAVPTHYEATHGSVDYHDVWLAK